MASDKENAKLANHQVRIYTEHNSSSGPNETIGTCNESGIIVSYIDKTIRFCFIIAFLNNNIYFKEQYYYQISFFFNIVIFNKK